MHAAKGLEFPVVFITGCEENLIPFKRGNTRHVDIQEERRLFYVAMTRAKDRLYLSRAKKRRIYGKFEDRVASHFVADIENRLKQDDTPRLKKRKKKVPEPIQLELFWCWLLNTGCWKKESFVQGFYPQNMAQL